MKKQAAVALILLLMIPLAWRLGLVLFTSINPESAIGHPNYARNYHYLSLAKHISLWGSEVLVVILWLLVCFMVIRSKQRSSWWLFLAAFGPFGFAVLIMLSDRTPSETDRHERFVRGLNRFLSVGYQVSIFVVLWLLASQAIDLKSELMIKHESATTGVPVAQIIALRDASSGMWAFAEGNEVMFTVVLLYLLWPMAFNFVARAASSSKTR